MPEPRRVVALGGGHGLAVVLRAARQYATELTAVVSVADDGGSSGRLRRDLNVLPPGDLRKCLVALAGPDRVWVDAFEHRFRVGELDGHSLGNLILTGLGETLGDPVAAIDAAARLLGAVGRVRPGTVERVELKAHVVQVCNLRPQPPETTGLDAADHLRAVLDHGGRVDTFLSERDGALPVDEDRIRGWEVRPVGASLAGRSGLVHDPAKLAQALMDLLESDQTRGYA